MSRDIVHVAPPYDPKRAEREAEEDLEKARASELWAKAVELLRRRDNLVPEVQRVYREAAQKDEADMWWAPYHFNAGMGIRNHLRTNGFGEKEFGVINMDNVYVALLEEAADIPESR